MELRVPGAPREDRLVSVGAPGRGCAERSEVCGEGCLGAPDGGFEMVGEGEDDAELAGRHAHGPLEPRPPLVAADCVRVGDLGFLARVEREAGLIVGEGQPYLLEGVAVVLDRPAHRLASALRLELQFVPGQRTLPVKGVGALGFPGVAVDGDPYEVAGDRFAACVAQESAHAQLVVGAVVRQACLVLQDEDPRGCGVLLRRLGRHWVAIVLLPRVPQGAGGFEFLVHAADQVGASALTAGFQVADVGGVDSEPSGQGCCGESADRAEVLERGWEGPSLGSVPHGGSRHGELRMSVSECGSRMPHPARLGPTGTRRPARGHATAPRSPPLPRVHAPGPCARTHSTPRHLRPGTS